VIGNADATADPVAITDNVKPTVTSATVGSDPAGPGVATITVVFSELMDTATPPTIRITGLATNPYTVTQSSYTANTWVGTFTVLDNNEAATATITVSGAKDVATNTMLADNTAGTFGVDTIAPVISNVNVDKTAYQATLDPIVVVTIVENNTADTVKVNGFDATETAIPGTWTYSLTHGGVIGRYSLSIDAADITGNTIQQFATSYDVVADGAPAAPVIAITNPTAGATLLATTTLTFTTNSGATTNAQVSIDGGAYTAATTNANPGTYVLDTTSLANGSHTLRVKDTVSGLTGYSDYVTFLVSNASDTTSPLFVSQVPAASSTNVSITPDDLYVSFNEALDPTTIGSTTVMLCLVDDPTCATPVNIGSPMLMENQKMIRLGGPNLILDNATSYWIKVTTGIADLAGNHLLADYGSPTTSQFTTESAPTGALAVDNISQIRYWGVANGGYDNGWEWVMSATIPTNANHFHLKFADWTSGGNTLPVAGNMKYWSEEITSGLRGSASNPVFITAANTYPDDIILDTDNNTSPNAPGMQTKIHIQVQIPSGQAGGSYSTSYGLEN
ncbi:MAG TPA: Ig-like domain-containing protein, partial [bacterium]|nr:Ig-like domain-containing protein [bacterium]